MGYSVNKATLLGNVGKDPEYKVIPNNGNSLCKFSMATTDKYKNKQDEMVETTEWHNVEIWGKLAEIADKYLKKGAKVYIEGKIKTESYEKDGVTRYSTKIIANDMVLLSGNSENSGTPKKEYIPKEEAPPASMNFTQDELDEVPF